MSPCTISAASSRSVSTSRSTATWSLTAAHEIAQRAGAQHPRGIRRGCRGRHPHRAARAGTAARHRCRARAGPDHQGRAVALCRRQRRDPRHPQCAGARHRRRRNRQFPLPRRAVDERDQGARERRRDRARPAPRVSDHQARDQPRRTAARVSSLRARSRFGLALADALNSALDNIYFELTNR